MNEEYVKIKDYPYYISNMGISHQNICKCLKGERKTAKGYSFRRA
jgi:hypothetical protein